jgi:pullulanase/glycogen debranching enzyme
VQPWPGAPYPQGARWDGAGTNFALYTEPATAVEVCLFDEAGGETRVALEESLGFVWHGYVPGVGPGQRYGFRVHGPWSPDFGWFCDPAKLLLDPYARAIEGGIEWGGDLGEHGRDSAAQVPRSIVVDPAFDWQDVPAPRTPWHETVIYETHVKGLTKRHPEVDPELRGTYAGLAHPAVVEHLRSLGVTAVELLPVHQFVHRRFLVDRGLRQYWGYDPIGYFAPHGEYSAAGDGGGQVDEFRRMVRALHAAGLEVILDVVFNHTGEGGDRDPPLSFRGVDNRTYYHLWEEPEPPHRVHCVDYTGTGNTLNFAHPQVLRLIMDSLRYWATELGVDGFRFDLASAIGRDLVERDTLDLDTADWTQTFFDRRSAFFDAIAQDPVLARVKRASSSATTRRAGPSGTAATATRGATSGAAPAASSPTSRLASPAAPTSSATTGASRSRASTSSRRTTASRSPTSSRTTGSTTRRTARRTATARTTTAAGTAASRGRRTMPACGRCGRGSGGTSSPCSRSRRACRCCAAATSSRARSAATTTRTARTTSSPGTTGRSTTSGATCSRSRAPSSRSGARTRCCAGAGG